MVLHTFDRRLLKTVSATFELMKVIIKTPKKLKIAANTNAVLGLKLLVETQVAIAFGTSEDPFIYITADINIVVNNKLGIFIKLFINSKSETDIVLFLCI